MTMDYLEMCKKGSSKDYKYSDDHRVPMLEILRNPTNYSDEEKIDTLLSFHKDTCANLGMGLYPSMDDASQDLDILKRFVPVLDALYSKDQRAVQYACYLKLRAQQRLFQMKAEMSVFLKSTGALLLDKDTKKWMLQKSQYDDYFDYDNDEQRLKDFEKETHNVLAKLRRHKFDMTKLQDSNDSDEYHLEFINNQLTEATKYQYKLLEEDVTRRSDKVFELMEPGHRFGAYLDDLKRQIEMLEMDFKHGTKPLDPAAANMGDFAGQSSRYPS
ncbi:hypothetical protein MKW92_008682 [Papaver armeniacum]|nr:hypothetical protein MKW92_008682 [Papaver armeniacum]